MNILYFTVFTGIESIPPGTSDQGVTIMKGFWYTMQHGGREKSKEESFPDRHKSTLHGDAVSSLTQPYNGKKSAATECLPHGLALWERSELLLFLFLMMCANTRYRWVPAYVEKVWSGFKRGHVGARRPSKIKRDRPRRNYNLFKSTVQLMLGDEDCTKVNPFQGVRKTDGKWDEVDYETVHQVANGSPLYEMKNPSGKMKVPHHNRLFLVATPQGASTALCQNKCANVDPTTRSGLAESTPLECDIDLPKNNVEERLSWCSTSLSLCGQVNGAWWPLFEVVPSTAMEDNRDGRRDKCASDDEPHWVPLVYFQAHNLEPNFQLWMRGERLHVTGVLMLGPGLISSPSWSRLSPW